MKNFISALTWSSVDPNKVSATITGAILMVSSAIIFVAGHYNIQLAPSDITNFATQIGATAGAIVTAFGLVRKLVIAIELKINPGDATPTA